MSLLCFFRIHRWRYEWTQYRARSLDGQYVRRCDRCQQYHDADLAAYTRNAVATAYVWTGLGEK